MYQGSRSFFDLCPRSLRMRLDLRGAIQNQWPFGLIFVPMALISSLTAVIDSSKVTEGNSKIFYKSIICTQILVYTNT